MKKELFKLRHAALVSALALAMGAPLALADDEVPADAGTEVVALPVEGGEIRTFEVGEVDAPAVVDEAPVDETPVDVAPGDDGVVTVDPLPGDGVEVVLDEPVAVDGGEVAVEDVPVDDCGMICWNTADMPPGAVQRSNDLEPEVLQFGVTGESPEPSLNVSAELSGAVGVAEQLGATDVALEDAANVDPLAPAAPSAAVVTTANAGAVNVIRDGHLR
jgi:hypothetical protein